MAKRFTASVVLFAFSLLAACNSSTQTPVAPAATPAVNTPAPPCPAPPDYPPVDRPARIYNFAGPVGSSSSDSVSCSTRRSRFVLFDDGTHMLQSPNGAAHGTYTQEGSVVIFGWEFSSAAGGWAATGTIVEDSLTVRYNMIMILTDFEDAVYKLGN